MLSIEDVAMTKSKRSPWWIFIGCSLMVLLVNIDTTIVNLALATIAKDLHASLVKIQWVINAYLLATTIFFIIGGKLADIYGAKRIFLIGTLLFAMASLVAGISVNFPMLLIGRVIQGIGFAFTLSLAFIMVTNVFPDEQRGLVVGLTVTMTGLGRALGPTVGGAILEEFNWHWIFLINVPLCIISLLIITFFAQSQRQQVEKQKLDFFGMILLGLAITALLLAFSALTHRSINFIHFSLSLILSFLLFAIFYWQEGRIEAPLVNFKLFKQPNYLLIVTIRFFYQYAYGAFLFFIPLFLQNLLGYSPLVAGLMILVFSAFLAILSPITGIWCDQSGYKPPIVFSSIVSFFGYLLLIHLTHATPLYIILLGLAFCGICSGTMVSSSNNATVASLPKSSKGEGLGIFFTAAFIGLSLGVAASGAEVNFISMHHLVTAEPNLANTLAPTTFAMLHRAANGTMPLSQLTTLVDPAIKQLAQQSFSRGLFYVMTTNMVITLIMIILSMKLKRNRER